MSGDALSAIIEKWFPVPDEIKEDGLGLTIPQARMVQARAIRALGEAMAGALNTARLLAQERKLHAEIESGLQCQIESVRREVERAKEAHQDTLTAAQNQAAIDRGTIENLREQVDLLEHRLTDCGFGGMQ